MVTRTPPLTRRLQDQRSVQLDNLPVYRPRHLVNLLDNHLHSHLDCPHHHLENPQSNLLVNPLESPLTSLRVNPQRSRLENQAVSRR